MTKAAAIQLLLNESSYSIEEISSKLEVSRFIIHRWKTGISNPRKMVRKQNLIMDTASPIVSNLFHMHRCTQLMGNQKIWPWRLSHDQSIAGMYHWSLWWILPPAHGLGNSRNGRRWHSTNRPDWNAYPLAGRQRRRCRRR